MKWNLQFDGLIHNREDLVRFTNVFKLLDLEYGVANMHDALLLYHIIGRIRQEDLDIDSFNWYSIGDTDNE